MKKAFQIAQGAFLIDIEIERNIVDNNDNDDDEHDKNEKQVEKQQTVGGKRAWKVVSDDTRNESLELFREHRRAELQQEIDLLTK